MTELVSVWGVLASLVLVGLAMAISTWFGLRVEQSIAWAAIRAGVQLVAVGFLLDWILDAGGGDWWAWVWVAGMVLISAEVVRRRAPDVPGLRWVALAAVIGTVAVVLGVIFGLQILDYQAVTVVVIAGITIGNTLPSAVLAADRMVKGMAEQRGVVEAGLALGLDGRQANRYVVTETARTALIPQIERTKVVGLIALPGAMTGLLLAGVDPIEAVLVQIVVMYLVLGSVATAALIVVTAISRMAFTADLRIADWVG